MVREDNSEVICLYGHVHSNTVKGYHDGMFHVGCDTNELSPISIQEIWEQSWPKENETTPELLPGKSHGRRSLVGYSPWGREESDTTERLHFHFSLSCNPLQCSCLENPRDGGDWWAAVYGVTESDTTEAS